MQGLVLISAASSPPRSNASRWNAYQDASRPRSAEAWPKQESNPYCKIGAMSLDWGLFLKPANSRGVFRARRKEDRTWGDENDPCLAAAIPPGFIPLKLSQGLVRERRVGGLKPWRSGLVQSLFAPEPFELVRSPTHHFPSRLDVIRLKKRRIGAENGGLDSVQDCRTIHFKRI